MAGYRLLKQLYYQTNFQNGTTTFSNTMLNMRKLSIVGFLGHLALTTLSITALSIIGNREY